MKGKKRVITSVKFYVGFLIEILPVTEVENVQWTVARSWPTAMSQSTICYYLLIILLVEGGGRPVSTSEFTMNTIQLYVILYTECSTNSVNFGSFKLKLYKHMLLKPEKEC